MSERTGLGKTHSEEAARALLERMPAFRHLGFRVIRATSDAFEVCVPFATEISYAPRSFPASTVLVPCFKCVRTASAATAMYRPIRSSR